MPASAAATETAGHEIEFGEHAVFSLIIIMNTFHQITSPSGKRILSFPRDQLIQGLKTIRTKTIEKSIGKERLGLVAELHFFAGTCLNVFRIANKFFFATGAYFIFFSHATDSLLPAVKKVLHICRFSRLIPDGNHFQSVLPAVTPVSGRPF